MTESGTTEQRTSLGEVRRVANDMVEIDLARGVSLSTVVDMSLFAKTPPEMPYEAAKAALGEPIASRVDSYNVTWRMFIVPSGHAEVGTLEVQDERVTRASWIRHKTRD